MPPDLGRMKNLSDEQLVTCYLQGNNAAFNEVVKRHGRELRQFLNCLCGEDKADEVYQDTLIRLSAKLLQNLYSHQEKFIPWIYTIARNVYRNSLKLNSTQRCTNYQDVLEEGVTADEDIASVISPSEEAILHTYINTLPASQREVLLLHYFFGLKFKTIAQLTGASLNTTLSRMRYAVKKLRVCYEH